MTHVHKAKTVEAPGGNLWRFCLWLVLFSLSVSSPAFAHRAHASLTEIVWNKSTQEVEITHRLYAHDLEPRLFKKVMSGWEESPEGIAQVGAYSAAKFTIRVKGKKVPLNYVGAEPDGEFIYVYFTAPRFKNGTELSVRDAILTDVFDNQVNLVNLTLDGNTQSQYFRFGEGARLFVWDLPDPD